jgi:hypothetical protein
LEGVWRAEMAEAAEGPDVDAMGCVRAVDSPAMGSDLETGHRLRAVRFLGAQSPLTEPLAPLVEEEVEEAEMVELLEELEARELRDEDEFVRCACFRGLGSSILERSSMVLKLPPPPLLPLHPDRLMF